MGNDLDHPVRLEAEVVEGGRVLRRVAFEVPGGSTETLHLPAKYRGARFTLRAPPLDLATVEL